jgi:glycosyltransferase involved in cell wall biosynthesis
VRVLHVQKVKGVGGSERHLSKLLPGLVARGIDVRMAVLAAPGYERFVELLNVETEVLRLDPLALVQRARWADIVHTHLIHADVIGWFAARLAGARHVSSVHSVHPSIRRQPLRAHRTIAISEHVATFLGREVRVVPYGTERWNVPPRDGSGYVVGIASRRIEGKGHEVLAAAAKRVGAQLLVAGDGPVLPDGELLGHVEDMRTFYARCDVVAVPTLKWLGEGFGLAALEAMAAGRAVVVSDAGSLPEVVGDAGVVVPAGSVEALAEALERLRDPAVRVSLGFAARERARTRYSLEAMIDGTIAVYRELA